MIGSEHVGDGYGADAVKLLTIYGFREMGQNRIEIRVHACNDQARAAYRKAGYIEKGCGARRPSTTASSMTR